jgi:hypothetical protein
MVHMILCNVWLTGNDISRSPTSALFLFDDICMKQDLRTIVSAAMWNCTIQQHRIHVFPDVYLLMFYTQLSLPPCSIVQ